MGSTPWALDRINRGDQRDDVVHEIDKTIRSRLRDAEPSCRGTFGVSCMGWGYSIGKAGALASSARDAGSASLGWGSHRDSHSRRRSSREDILL